MNLKKVLIILSIISCLAFFTACTTEKADPPSRGSIEFSSEEPSASFEDNTGNEDKTHSSKAESSGDTSASEPPASPNSSSRESSSEKIEPEIEVLVKIESLVGSEEKTITDETQIRQILAYTDGMFRSDYNEPPNTGGEIITVFITRDNNTEKYTFVGTEVDGYDLAKNSQDPDVANTWYFAELGAYQYLYDLFEN